MDSATSGRSCLIRRDARLDHGLGRFVGQLFANSQTLESRRVVFVGDVPYHPDDLGQLLPPTATSSFNELAAGTFPDVVVIGQQDCSECFLQDCMVAAHAGTRFLPQEGFLELVLFGLDWWSSEPFLLDNACNYYPGLAFVRSSSVGHLFTWPDSRADPVLVPTGSDERKRQQTLLNSLGYNTALHDEARWAILTRIIDRAEMPLEQVVNLIAWYCRNCRRQEGGENRYRRALSRWSMT